jgi:hypothetical protein
MGAADIYDVLFPFLIFGFALCTIKHTPYTIHHTRSCSQDRKHKQEHNKEQQRHKQESD